MLLFIFTSQSRLYWRKCSCILVFIGVSLQRLKVTFPFGGIPGFLGFFPRFHVSRHQFSSSRVELFSGRAWESDPVRPVWCRQQVWASAYTDTQPHTHRQRQRQSDIWEPKAVFPFSSSPFFSFTGFNDRFVSTDAGKRNRGEALGHYSAFLKRSHLLPVWLGANLIVCAASPWRRQRLDLPDPERPAAKFCFWPLDMRSEARKGFHCLCSPAVASWNRSHAHTWWRRTYSHQNIKR